MHARTHARKHACTENIYSIFRDKLLLLGEHGFRDKLLLLGEHGLDIVVSNPLATTMVLLFVVCGWWEKAVAGVCLRTYLVHSTYGFFGYQGYERRKNCKLSCSFPTYLIFMRIIMCMNSFRKIPESQFTSIHNFLRIFHALIVGINRFLAE